MITIHQFLKAYLYPPIPKLMLYRAKWFMMRRMGVDRKYIETINPFVNEPKWFVDSVKNCTGSFIDIGAGVGDYLNIAVKAKKKIAFEPDPRCYNVITKLFRSNPDITVFKLALWSGFATVTMTYTNTLKQSTAVIPREGKKQLVYTASLDQIMFAGLLHDKISYPVTVKIDTEGAEPYIIKGMSQFLARYQPHLLIEYHNNLKEVLKILRMNGYKPTHHTANKYADFEHGWLKASPVTD